MSFVYAHIHRGAYFYWYKNHFGIKTPHNDKWDTRKIKIGAYDEYDRSYFQRVWAIVPNVKIYKGESNNGTTHKYRGYEIFKNTIHELTHVSHWRWIVALIEIPRIL